jgi:hypothetical protein
MNYRRGFQRVYVSCSVLWTVGVLALSIRDRPRTIDYDALAAQYGGTAANDPHLLTDAEISELDNRPKPKTPFVPPPLSSYQGDAPRDNGPLRIVKSEPLPGAVRSYWIARSETTVLPPLAIYLFFFCLIPWIYRGFKPGKQA